MIARSVSSVQGCISTLNLCRHSVVIEIPYSITTKRFTGVKCIMLISDYNFLKFRNDFERDPRVCYLFAR